nr:hypothetical protein Iba_chr06aCG15150 [Ipomoea batatas]
MSTERGGGGESGSKFEKASQYFGDGVGRGEYSPSPAENSKLPLSPIFVPIPVLVRAGNRVPRRVWVQLTSLQ